LKAESGWQPVTSTERYRSIDIIRGLALFGVLVVNILTMFRIPLLEHILMPHNNSGQANQLVSLLVAGFLEFKALTIFSFLFGVGVAIQAERATASNVSARGFLGRRLAWLFILGAAHMFLIWNGDILALYAVCGLLLLPFLGLPWPVLLVIGAVVIAVPEVIPLGLPLPSGEQASAHIAQARQAYGSAEPITILAFRWHESWSLILPLLVGILPRTTGLMIWGVAAWRSGILREPDRHRSHLTTAFAGAGVVGALATADAVWARSSGGAPWIPGSGLAAPILLALAYVSGLLLWLTPRRASALPGLTAAGRMALTNYLLQSIALGFIFYGYGLGLFGRIGAAAAAGIGIVLYAAQLHLSLWWLRHFRFGPFEWLWRSLAYG